MDQRAPVLRRLELVMGLAEQGEDARREEHRVVDQVPVVDRFVDRFERLGIARLAGRERALHLLFGGDVAHGADQADGPAVGTAHRAGAILQPAHLAGADPDAVLALEAVGALHEIVAQRIAIVRIVLRHDALVPLLGAQAARIEGEHAVELRRDEQRVVGDVPLVEPFRRRLGDQGVTLLAGAQCGLGAADVGDIGDGEQQAAVRHPAMAGDRAAGRRRRGARPCPRHGSRFPLGARRPSASAEPGRSSRSASKRRKEARGSPGWHRPTG